VVLIAEWLSWDALEGDPYVGVAGSRQRFRDLVLEFAVVDLSDASMRGPG
jgi:hypothetical protein